MPFGAKVLDVVKKHPVASMATAGTLAGGISGYIPKEDRDGKKLTRKQRLGNAAATGLTTGATMGLLGHLANSGSPFEGVRHHRPAAEPAVLGRSQAEKVLREHAGDVIGKGPPGRPSFPQQVPDVDFKKLNAARLCGFFDELDEISR